MLKSNCFLCLVLITLICLTTPLIAQVELDSHWGGGKCQAVTVSETHVFAGFGSFLFSINIESFKIMGVYSKCYAKARHYSSQNA